MSVHKTILQRFNHIINNGRLAHAYLFVGPADVGKMQTALALAKRVNCENIPADSQDMFCDLCPSCLKINSGNHPDILIAETNKGQTIKIAEIRALVSRMQLRPFEARSKVFIIKNVESLTLEGANALLKTLEEPALDSLLILTTEVPERCLSTVRSRCQCVHFFPGHKDDIIKQLLAEYSVDQDVAHFLAFFSEGCLGRASRLRDENLFEKKNDIIDQMVFSSENDDYVKGVLADKKNLKNFLNVLLSWFRDLMLIKGGVNQQDFIVNVDRKQDLLNYVTRYSFDQLEGIVEAIVAVCKYLDDNLNLKVPMLVLKERIWVK